MLVARYQSLDSSVGIRTCDLSYLSRYHKYHICCHNFISIKGVVDGLVVVVVKLVLIVVLPPNLLLQLLKYLNNNKYYYW